MKRLGKISLWIQAVFYLVAGINHFVSTAFYLTLIPPDIPFPKAINIMAGICEIFLGLGLIVLPKYRKLIVVSIILFLLALLPAHIYHLMQGGCLSNGFCLPVWACWVRIFLQFVLIGWAWSIRKVK